MTTQRPTLAAMAGRFSMASAMLVSGPSVTRTRPGWDSMVAMMASVALRCSGERVGRG